MVVEHFVCQMEDPDPETVPGSGTFSNWTGWFVNMGEHMNHWNPQGDQDHTPALTDHVSPLMCCFFCVHCKSRI